MPSLAHAGEGDTTAMQNLFPIIRRQRRALVLSEARKPDAEGLERTEATEMSKEVAVARANGGSATGNRSTENEKETDAHHSHEGESR